MSNQRSASTLKNDKPNMRTMFDNVSLLSANIHKMLIIDNT